MVESNADPDLEYCRSRAKEHRERYEGMRTLEWQTLLQTYAGYAAIAVAFQNADGRFHDALWFRCAAMWVTLVFAAAMHYLHYRIEERLITFNENYEFYVNQTRGQKGEDGANNLGHPYFWTYDTQMLLGTLTAVGMLVYEGFPAPPAACAGGWWCQLIAVLVAWVAAIGTWFRGRAHLDRLSRELGARASATGHK
ncbi:MAG: hypothetical protein ABSF98_10325 [Bryobacteraceae bacterium]|jgi:hypothetical protein